ncbi:hypothetical protein, partial [Nostoc sp.]|uniref:hypothetical protein n=1 Tax=Nostoc sp. TaxID=1180 RepID=UPI003593624F
GKSIPTLDDSLPLLYETLRERYHCPEFIPRSPEYRVRRGASSALAKIISNVRYLSTVVSCTSYQPLRIFMLILLDS